MAKTPKKYTVTVRLNGEEHTVKSDNVEEALLMLKPKQLFTEVAVIVKEGKNVTERWLRLIQARKIFNDDFHRQVFINNLLLT